MKSLFKRKNKKLNLVNELIRAYINSQLPENIITFEPLSSDDQNTINLISKPSTVSFTIGFLEEIDMHDLNDDDKQYIIENIIIPGLKEIDKDLFSIHKNIEKTIKELDSQ